MNELDICFSLLSRRDHINIKYNENKFIFRMRAEPLTIGNKRCRESEQEQRRNSKYVLSLSVV